LLPTADVLSFHCPLTDETRHLLDNERLQRIKPGCLVVNCARGGILDEQAALAALSAGLLGGLAVDVLPVEPPRDGHPLLDALQRQRLNLIVTPHNAWISPQARQNIIRLTAENIDRLAAG
jgi:glycerate dehydrogenase